MHISILTHYLKNNRKLLLWMALWLVGVLALISTRTQTLQKTRTAEEVTEYWRTLIIENQRYLKASGSTVKNAIERNKEQIATYSQQLASLNQQVAAYTFVLNNYDDRNDAFEIMLRCRQISVLHTSFKEMQKRIDLWKSSITRTNEQVMIIHALIAERNNQTAQSMRDAIDQNIRERLGNISNATHFAENIATISAHIAKTQQDLDELYQHANQKRTNVIENMFSAKPASFFSTFRRFSHYLPLWQIKLSGYLRNQVPLGIRFLVQFGLLLLLVATLFHGINRKWITPTLHRLLILPTDIQNTTLFNVGVWLLIVATTCEVANAFVPGQGTDEAIFRQPANAFCSTAILLMALTLRNAEARTFSQVLAVTLPIITQHFCSMLLYLALAPRIAILCLIPPINIACALWLMAGLRKIKTTPLLFTTALLSIFASLAAAWLACIGYAYLAFTFTHGWQVLLSQVILVIVITFNLMKLAHHPGQRKQSILLKNLAIPFAWYALVYSLFAWTTRTYHLDDYFAALFSSPLITHSLVTITFNKIILIVLIATLLHFCIIFFSESVRTRSEKKGTDPALVASALTLSTYISWAVFVIVALVICEINTKSLQVMLGGFGLGLGFALKGLVENFFCGVSLLVGQEIRPGDTIEIDQGSLATVKKITFGKTIVETLDGAIITYPNVQVKAKEFRNWTRNHRFRRYDIVVDVAYGTDLTRARNLLLEAVRLQPNIELHYPSDPIVFISGFQDSSIRFVIRFWTAATLYLDVATQLQIKINTLFEENHILIPFPQLDVHVTPANTATST